MSFDNVNCSFESTSIVIVDVEIFHVRPIFTKMLRLARSIAAGREIISEDAVSGCVCILLLSRKPVVVSSSRLFAPGSHGRYPAPPVSYVRNRAFPVMPCAPMLYQNSPLIFPYSEAPASTLSQFIIRNRLSVSTFAL